ncbi:MAG: nicotinate-nucleotide adenylyltransferase [Luteimonas sp.]|nr:nicotinate-nucleotide adenylyltransferase [Luteimonas sp.]
MKLRTWYGGTFDPVHDGHLAIARAARDALDCAIRFMPAADPPHRAPPGADAAQRAEMLRLAIDGEPGLRVDLRELRRDGPSYSVDTLRGLRAEYGEAAPIALLVGADSLLGLPTWHDWTALFGLAHFVVADRPGSALDARLPPVLAEAVAGRWIDDPAALREAPAGCLLRLHQPLHPGSATDVRRLIRAGGPWRARVPAAVAGYIVRERLYGVDGAVDAPSL